MQQRLLISDMTSLYEQRMIMVMKATQDLRDQNGSLWSTIAG